MRTSDAMTIIRRSWVTLAASVLLGLGLGALVHQLTPPNFVSAVDFYVSTPTSKDGNLSAASQFAQTRVDTYVGLMSSDYIAARVVASSGVDLPQIEVRRSISATNRLNTVVISATVTSGSKETSAALAKGLAAVMGPAVSNLDNVGEVKAVQIDVISGPTEPVESRPGLLTSLAVGLAAGLLFGTFFAVALQVVRPRVTENDDVTRLTATGLLGTVEVPSAGGRPRGAAQAHGFRKVRSALRVENAETRQQVLTVMSAVEGEGHAAVAAGIAGSLAELGDRVLLVDTDGRTQTGDGAKGRDQLSQVLSGAMSLSDSTSVSADVPGLSTIGSMGRDDSAALTPRTIAAFVKQARHDYDHVVISAPPLNASANATMLAPQSDGVILAVRLGSPSPEALESASRQVRVAGGTLIGAVITRVDGPRRRRA